MKWQITLAILLILSSFTITINEVKAEYSYFTYSDFKNEMQSLTENYSSIANLYSLGKTINGREILALKISDNPKINETEPSILIVGGHHGNEKISVMIPFLLAKYLLENSYETRIAKLIEEKQVFIIPMLNSDGYEKNQRKNDNGTGVDLNRNYNYEFGVDGQTSDNPNSNYYHGEFAFSEYETQAIRNLTSEIDFSIAITFHSYGKQITYPWAYTTNKTKDDALFKKIAERYSDFNNYAVMQDSSLYTTRGDFNDFMYGNRSSFSFTVELGEEHSPTDISKVFYENLNSSIYLIELTGEEEKVHLPLWTFAVYMAGDNDLEEEGIKDFNEIEIVGSTNEVNIVIQFDRANNYDTTNGDWKSAKRFYVKKDKNTKNISSQEIQDIGEVDMSNKDTLYNFLIWVVENYPSQHYFVDIWNHGKDIFNGVIRDDSHGGKFMMVWDFADALKKFKQEKGIKLSIIGFDVCTLGFIETGYQLKNYADYLLASEKEEPEDGWLYNMSLQKLADNPYMNAEEIGKEIVDDYIYSYEKNIQTTTVSIQLALTNLYRIGNLTTSINEFSDELINNSYLYNSQIKNTRNKTESYENPDFVDLFHFAKLIFNDNSLPNSLREKANNLMNEFNKTIVANGKYQKGSSVSNANGLVIYFEKDYANYNFIYDNSTKIYFANEKWNEFLKAFYKVPIIWHTQLKDDIIKEFYNVSAKIIDDNLNETSVYYRTNFNSSFTKLNMNFIGNNLYFANIPYENSSIIYYYISAEDKDGNIVKTETYSFRIEKLCKLFGNTKKYDGEILKNIYIFIRNEQYNFTAISDNNGNFVIDDIPYGNYEIFAIGTDYIGITNNFTLSQNPSYLNITMVYLMPKIQILNLSYSSAIENESFEIKLTLKNFGIMAENYTAEFYADGVLFYTTIFNISSLQILEINATLNLQKGNYKIKAIVINHRGIEKEISVNVKEKPKAKLEISEISYTIDKNEVIIEAIIKNIGNKIAENVSIKIFIDGNLKKNETVNISSFHVSVLNLSLKEGKHEIRVEVSYGNEILTQVKEFEIKNNEENGGNNNLLIVLILIFAVVGGWLISVWVRWRRGMKYKK